MMKKRLIIAVCAIVLFGAMIALIKHSQQDTDARNKARIENIEVKFAPNDNHYLQRAFPLGKIDYNAIAKAKDYRKEIRKSSSLRNDESWKFVGPKNVDGRITDIEVLNSGVDRLMVGTASGGVFKFKDVDSEWMPIFDDADNLSIGDIALAPSNNDVIYVGTGEANAGGGSLTYDGNGIYKSLNRGDTWNHIGLSDVGSIGKIVVSPNDPNTCFVAAMGKLFSSGPERGLYKTNDGGLSWEKILFINDSTGVIDLAIHPSDPLIIYACTWERSRRPGRRNYGGPGSAIYRSIDGGNSWDKLIVGLPTSSSRIGIAISKSNPLRLYAYSAHPQDQSLQGIYTSNDGGNSWTSLDLDNVDSVPFMYWFGKIFIHPTDEHIVFLSSLNMFSTHDGGENWDNAFPGAHVDHHAIAFDPLNPDVVYNGNDGGVSKSVNLGASSSRMSGLPNTQFYTSEIDYSNPELLYGGTQDNGTNRVYSDGFEGEWQPIYFGDGFVVKVDPEDNSFVYAEYQNGNFAKSTNGGLSFTPSLDGISNSDRNNWKSPFELDPSNSSTLYFGTNKLYKSTNRAESWMPISGDLTTNPAQQNITFGTLTTISNSPINSEVIIIGTDDGNVQVSSNAGDSWSLVSDDLPLRWVTSVEADPNNVNGIYVCFSGYRYGSSDGHIFYSDNLGQSWQDISGNLPDIPVNDLEIVPSNGNLYLATDIGVFVSTDLGANWEMKVEGIPSVVVNDLTFHPPTGKLIAATYGRGMYEAYFESPPSKVDEKILQTIQISVFPNPFVGEITIKIDQIFSKEVDIDLYNIQGRMVQKLFSTKRQSGNSQHKINLSSIPAGVYYLNVRTKSGGFLKSLTIVKQ